MDFSIYPKPHINNKPTEYEPSLKERIEVCRNHYELLKEDKNSIVCLNLTKNTLVGI